ncbi:MAG: iron complex outermembrane receptor protein [Halieaceae bacterium]|jgi:iron complex outermembrane receptor protein
MYKKIFLPTIIAALACQSTYAAQLEEIVVTAQKRAQSLQDVPLSVSAISGEEVDRLNLNNVSSLATIIPNLTAMDSAAGNPSFRIRGVGLNEFSAAYDSPVGIHLDETFLFKPVLASLGFYDVERVEALKGPQGTVFGRNTTGGAVNFYSNRPTEEFEAGMDLSYGNYERIEANGFVSGKLSDTLKGRLAVEVQDYAYDEGPWKNLYDGKRIGELEQQQARGMLEWNGDATTVLGTLEVGSKKAELTPYDNLFQSEPGAHPTAPDVPGVWNPELEIRDPMSRDTVNADHTQATDADYWGARLRIDHELDLGTFTSLTSYKDFERENIEDSDNTPTRSVNIDWNTKLDSLSQEFRLAGDRDTWTYLLGVYYEDDNTEIVELVDSRDFLESYFGDDYKVDTESWAIFTNNEYAFTESISVVLGARYTEEQVSIDGAGYAASPTAPIGNFSRVAPEDRIAVISVDESRTDTDFNWKVGLNYTPNEDVLVYSSVSTGFRSGGYDMTFGGLALDSPLLTFDPEDVTAVDLGVKSRLLDGAMTLNLALFYTEVDDYQDNVNQGEEIVPRRRNVGTLETYGFESDLQWQMHENWMIKWGLGYTSAEVTDSDELVNGSPLDGTTPVNTPEWSTSLLLNYNRTVSEALVLDVLVSGQWLDERYLEPENGPDHLVESYSTVDASVALMSSDGKWSVSLWGRNLTDEDYLQYINDVPAFGLFLTIKAEPATYGVAVNYNFD